jgi:hypothetical protein
MKTIKLILLIIGLGLLTSCTHKSKIKHEKGVVVEKQFTPAVDQNVTGTGISSKGTLSMSTHHISADQQFIVVFKCEHGVVFSINRNELYASLEKNDTVDISYYENLNSKEEIVDFDFQNAVPTKQTKW